MQLGSQETLLGFLRTQVAVPAISVVTSLLLTRSTDNDLIRKVRRSRRRFLRTYLALKLGVKTSGPLSFAES